MTGTVSEKTYLWSRVLENIRDKLNDQNIFEAFFANSYIRDIEGKTIVVVVNSGLAKTILETRYIDLLDQAVIEVFQSQYDLSLIKEEDAEKMEAVEEAKPRFFADSRLRPEYTFKNFVMGASNREAYQASLLVARDPGKPFNPLLIYSNSGLGKTHLLNAIGNRVRESFPGMKVLYTTAADFIDEYIKFARGNTQEESLATYFKTNVDVFLVDDIQLLVGRPKTMEMFFMVFSSLYAQHKQIVITSDQHPNLLDGLDDRLRTRFISGLTLSIEPPDLVTSEGILKSRITANGLDLDDFEPDVIPFLAQRFSSSVRELEEALNRLLFYTINIKPTKHIDLAIAKEAIQGLVKIQDDQGKITDQKIISTVADYYNLTPSQITGRIRTSQIALARHICMYLMRSILDDPFAKIGKALGGKDHATVMSGVQKVEKELKTNPQMKEAIDELKNRLGA